MPDRDTSLAVARQLSGSWTQGTHIDQLAGPWKPATRADGYAVQALWPELLGRRVAGWKIAATSQAGQAHIAVSGPLAGPVFEHRVQASGATVSLAANRMRVAECEVVFRMARALSPRPQGWTRTEVLAAVESVHPGLEVPDSRFAHFERAGEAQLIADCACMCDMVLGAGVAADARLDSLADLHVQAELSDGRRPDGVGRNALGDPCEALVWLVNELGLTGRTLEAGQFVTTGACVVPIPVTPGVSVQADFGWLGSISARFA